MNATSTCNALASSTECIYTIDAGGIYFGLGLIVFALWFGMLYKILFEK